MHTRSRFLVATAMAGLLLLVGASCSTSTPGASVSPPVVGAHVLAPENGDGTGLHWKEGTIDQISGTIYTVKFKDGGDIVARPLTAIAPYPAGSANVKVGDTVIATFATSFYKAQATAIKGSVVTVKWDDGSSPSDKDLTEITKTYK